MDTEDNILDAPTPKAEQDPKSNFLRGIVHTFIYYGTGLGLATLSYFIVGHRYPHAPGMYHWIVFLTFVGGFIWVLAAALKYISGTRTWKLKGIVLTNAVAVLSFVLLIYAILHEEAN